MAFCENNKQWTIDVRLDSDRTKVERLAFDLAPDGSGGITGTVRVGNGELMSRVRVQCDPLQGTTMPVAVMSFIFRVRKGNLVQGVHLSGVAHPPEANPKFNGRLRTFTPDINTPPSEGVGELQSIALLPDSGDTGTGTGQQT